MSWPIVTLGELALIVRNGMFASRPTDEPPGTRILRISAVRDGRVNNADSKFVANLMSDQIEKFSVRPGDLLVTRYNGSRSLVGISGIVPPHEDPIVYPDKLIRIVVDRSLADPRFVNYQFQSSHVRAYLEPRIRTTAGQSGINGADLRSVPLALPPCEEQRRIVDLLEDHLSRLDAARRWVGQARIKLDALVRSSLEAQFSGDNVVPLPVSWFAKCDRGYCSATRSYVSPQRQELALNGCGVHSSRPRRVHKSPSWQREPKNRCATFLRVLCAEFWFRSRMLPSKSVPSQRSIRWRFPLSISVPNSSGARLGIRPSDGPCSPRRSPNGSPGVAPRRRNLLQEA